MLKLKEVLVKAAADLSDEEKAFLKENVERLTDSEKEKFADVLGEGVDSKALEALVAKTMESFAKKLGEISDGLVEKTLERVAEARAKALNGEDTKKDEKADTKTRTFVKALLDKDFAKAKALTTSTTGSSPDDADAGLTIPDELLAEVLRIRPLGYGIARQEMRYLPFSGPKNSRRIPALGSSVNVYWTDEGEKKTSTQPKFTIVTQTLKKLAAICPFTEEILEDSAINLTALIAELFAEAVSQEEDLQFFAGTGTPWTGILNNANVNQVSQLTGGVANLTADDLLNMQDETPAGAQANAKYYLHRKTFSIIRKLKDLNGNYIVQSPVGSIPGTIWNKPYVLCEAMPQPSDVGADEAYVIYGDLKLGCIFGDKQQLRVKMLDQATITDTDGQTTINLAEQDMVALRIVERVGYVVALPTAITVLKNSGESES